MQTKRIHYVLAAISFLVAFATYATTMQPSIPFWDCGEFLGAAAQLGISHPPGMPTWTLIGHVLAWFVPLSDNQWSPAIAPTLFPCYGTGCCDPKIQPWYADGPVGTQPIANFECGGGFIANHGKKGSLSMSSHALVDTTDPTWLYWVAMGYGKGEPQFALDTMRLFVERHANLFLAQDALGKTVDFTADIAIQDSYYIVQDWIDEYNWLASVYSLDTAQRYHAEVLANMAASEHYFDRNGEANLWYNFSLLYPDSQDVSLAWREIESIRSYQQLISEDTTPFHVIPIPPVPFGASYVRSGNQIGSLDFSETPNPANKHLQVVINAPYETPMSLILYDELGKAVRILSTGNINLGENIFDFDISDIQSGSYYLRLAAANDVKTLRVVKE